MQEGREKPNYLYALLPMQYGLHRFLHHAAYDDAMIFSCYVLLDRSYQTTVAVVTLNSASDVERKVAQP